MSAVTLRVLLALAEPAIGLAVGAALRRRGHQVTTVSSGADALQVAGHDVIVIDAALADRPGLELALELQRRGSRAALVLLADSPSFDDCRAALHVGLRDVLSKPCGLDEVVASVERAAPKAALPSRESAAVFTRRYGANADGLDAGMRELLAQLVRWSFGPSTRARIAGATHELVDNVLRHAYPKREGSYDLRAELDGRELVVTVTDQGSGLDPIGIAVGSLADVHDGAHSGLARVAALAEDLRIEAALGRGTRVTLRFAAYRVQFDEEEAIDLSELDYLTPEMSARVLAGLRGEDEPSYNLSPALAVSVGRMLAGPTVKKSLQVALWS
ncbi:MAG: response regulator [Planctomycetes bacterium]|nr:response regulator [Planctomycetota bacterium]